MDTFSPTLTLMILEDFMPSWGRWAQRMNPKLSNEEAATMQAAWFDAFDRPMRRLFREEQEVHHTIRSKERMAFHWAMDERLGYDNTWS